MSEVDQLLSRLEHVEAQRLRYWRQMWSALAVVRELAPARADALVEGWDAVYARDATSPTSSDPKGGS